jgi:hypothetical protein
MDVRADLTLSTFFHHETLVHGNDLSRGASGGAGPGKKEALQRLQPSDPASPVDQIEK